MPASPRPIDSGNPLPAPAAPGDSAAAQPLPVRPPPGRPTSRVATDRDRFMAAVANTGPHATDGASVQPYAVTLVDPQRIFGVTVRGGPLGTASWGVISNGPQGAVAVKWDVVDTALPVGLSAEVNPVAALQSLTTIGQVVVLGALGVGRSAVGVASGWVTGAWERARGALAGGIGSVADVGRGLVQRARDQIQAWRGGDAGAVVE